MCFTTLALKYVRVAYIDFGNVVNNHGELMLDGNQSAFCFTKFLVIYSIKCLRLVE